MSLFWVNLAFLLLFLALRLVPLYSSKKKGCDAYFFLLCAEEFRRRPGVPVTLPGLYLLEPDEQWYPPMFYVFLGLFPEKWIKENYWLINHLLDLLVGFLILNLASLIGTPLVGLLVAAMYALDESIIMEYQNMTSRPLGCVLFFSLLGSAWLGIHAHPLWMGVAVVCGVLLVYTHKLACQLVWFLFPFLMVVRGEVQWGFLLLAMYAGAFAVYPGFFVKLIRAHFDIISFWSRYWPWLGAHQVKSSPVYGDGRPAGFFEGTRWDQGKAMTLRILLSNAWIIPALFGAALMPEGYVIPLAQVCVGGLVWVVLTSYIPFFRGVGEGTKYIKYLLPPSLILVAASVVKVSWLWLLVVPLALRQVRQYVRSVRNKPKTEMTGSLNECLEKMFAHMRQLEDTRTFCLPLHLSDTVAYHTRNPVFFGTHGYGFKEAAQVFPVLQRPVEDCVREYGLTHLLLDTTYASVGELRLEGRLTTVAAFGNYELLSFRPEDKVRL